MQAKTGKNAYKIIINLQIFRCIIINVMNKEFEKFASISLLLHIQKKTIFQMKTN